MDLAPQQISWPQTQMMAQGGGTELHALQCMLMARLCGHAVTCCTPLWCHALGLHQHCHKCEADRLWHTCAPTTHAQPCLRLCHPSLCMLCALSVYNRHSVRQHSA